MNDRRRAFLSTVGSVSVGGTLALAGCAGDSKNRAAGRTTSNRETTETTETSTATSSTTGERTVRTSLIRKGTKQETIIYEINSGTSGPTAYVEGGMHGNEESGYWAAEDIRTWDIDAGTLIVLPKANVRGVRHERREWPGEMDLNRQFPIGDPPKNALAREIWAAIGDYDPDVFIDLHSSKGIFEREGDDGVGQNVLRSKHPKIVNSVGNAVKRLNDEYVTGYSDVYDFVSTPLTETKYARTPMLVNKMRADRDTPSCLFEVTQDDVKPKKRARWTKVFVDSMLDTWGIRASRMNE
ncbi:deacylase-like protein [Haladaptatus sp. R4]|uniref:succinylglutamate desuccinylase/aspartoacylase family protein n=1 Tax=Haladaptatus sp. R4 TaxID=1679489 RepID=UPI0007B484CA|nr:succinylglutamate desuccinylase/aspartoacylase family protein [Haladaptatus sp. R4]KZN24042.1 deacylase-like protein [Haladaptatus sp. R4]